MNLRICFLLAVSGWMGAPAFSAPAASRPATASQPDDGRVAHGPRRGAIVLACVPGSQAQREHVEPGDIITHVAGQEVTSQRDIGAESGQRRNSEREVVIHSRNGRRAVVFGPGALGVWLADYDEAYGQPLVEALRLFHDRRYPEACSRFREAIAAGLPFKADSFVQPLYGVSCYYAGDEAAAREQFESFAKSDPKGEGWRALHFNLPGAAPMDGHLYLYVSRRALEERPDDVDVALNVPVELCSRQSRYCEAIVRSWTVLSRTPRVVSDYGEGVALNNSQKSLYALGLLPEAAECVRRLAADEGASSLWTYAAQTAEAVGRSDLAIRMCEEAIGANHFGVPESARTWQVLGLLLAADRIKEADRLLKELDPYSRQAVFRAVQHCNTRWGEARLMWAGVAREMLNGGWGDECRIQESAFEVLARQASPDIAELDRIVTARLKNDTDGDAMSWRVYMPVMLDVVRGRYAEAKARLDSSRSSAKLPASVCEAVAFLDQHGVSLTGDREVWRRTWRAFAIPTGGWFLVTSEQRIGRADADARSIREIPLPAPDWSPYDLDEAILVSATGKTVVTTTQRRIYRLGTDERGWTHAADLPRETCEASEGAYGLGVFAPVLDDVLGYLQAPDAPRRNIEWPAGTRHVGDDRLPCVMLSDGTWLACDLKARRVLLPVPLLSEAAAQRVEIYQLVPAASSCEQVYAFTSRGLFEWQPFAGVVKAVPLPGVKAPKPVLYLTDNIAPGDKRLRIALFPEDGGATFLLDQGTGTVVREGCINEAYPETFWRQKSLEAKRDMVKNAMKEAGLKWPFGASPPGVTRPTEPRPMSRG